MLIERDSFLDDVFKILPAEDVKLCCKFIISISRKFIIIVINNYGSHIEKCIIKILI